MPLDDRRVFSVVMISLSRERTGLNRRRPGTRDYVVYNFSQPQGSSRNSGSVRDNPGKHRKLWGKSKAPCLILRRWK